MKLVKGQIVYLKPDGNFWRGKHDDKTIFEAKVDDVGRKYAYLILSKEIYGCSEKIDLEEMREASELSPNYWVFVKKEDIYERPQKIQEIKDQISKLRFDEIVKVQEAIVEIYNNRL